MNAFCILKKNLTPNQGNEDIFLYYLLEVLSFCFSYQELQFIWNYFLYDLVHRFYLLFPRGYTDNLSSFSYFENEHPFYIISSV